MNDFVYHITDSIDHIIRSIPLFKVELALAIGFILTIACTLFFDRFWKHASFSITLLTLLASIVMLFSQYNLADNGFYGLLTIDRTGYFSRLLILFGLVISLLFLQQHFQAIQSTKRRGDLFSVLLAAGIGMNLLTITNHWLMAFLAIEMVSISSYILVGYFSANKKQAEAAMKYALFGSACSAVMLYGLSLVYGFTGDLNFASARHIQGLIAAPEVMTSIAFLFVFVGIGFKLSFVPFHLWAPDVYEGAPTPVTAFLSTVPKIGAIILFARLAKSMVSTQFFFSELTLLFIIVVAIATMLFGNLIALRQLDIKRMMAYSSIGHTGFLLMAIIAYINGNQDILFFYLFIYTIMNLATFAFIDVLEQRTGSSHLNQFAGLGKTFPLLFTCFSIVGISLIGLPPTAGFVGKLLVFTSIFELYQNTPDPLLLALLVVGALTSVISLFYYFKIPLYAFLRSNRTEDNSGKSQSGLLMYGIGVLLSVLVLLLGIFPSLLMDWFAK